MSQGQLERFDVEINKIQVNISSKYEFVKLWEIANLWAWWTPRRWIDNFWKNWSIPWLKSWELKDNLNITEIEEKITEEWLKKSSARLFRKWTLVIAMYWATTWEVWILWIDSTTNQAVCSIIPKIEINQNYLFWFLLLSRSKIKSETFWWAQPNISKEYLENFKIPLPPLEIQNQIVEKMDFALNEKKRKEKKAKDLLESIDDFVLNELWIEYKEIEEKKIFGLNLSELGETKRIDSFYNNPKFLELEKMLKNGKYWVEKLDEIKEKIITGTTPLSTSEPYWENWIIFFRNTNLEKNNINLNDVKYVKEEFSSKLTYSQLNDVIVCIAWTIWVSATNNVWKIAINQNVSALRLKENILADYVSIFLNNKILEWFFDRVSSVATIKYINNENLLSIFLPLPSLETQEKIALEVKSRIEKAKILENEAKEIYEKAKREVERMILV